MQRLRVLALLGAVIFLALIGRLFTLSIIHGPAMRARSAVRDLAMGLQPHRRGAIIAADGAVLAEDTTAMDLTSTIANVFPDRVALYLLCDQLNAQARRQELTGESVQWAPSGTMEAGALLARWRAEPGTERVRIAADLRLSQAQAIRRHFADAFGESNNPVEYPRRQAAHPGVPVLRELWLDTTRMGLVVDDFASWEAWFTALCARVEGAGCVPGMIARIGRELGAGAGQEPAVVRAAVARAFTREKDVMLLAGLPPAEAYRLWRHRDLNRPHFPGVTVSVRAATISFCRGATSFDERLRACLSAGGVGSAAIEKRFLDGAARFLRRMDELGAGADRLYRLRYARMKETRDAFAAWQLAEAWRGRYLQSMLCEHRLPLVRDLPGTPSNGDARLLSLLPEWSGLAPSTRFVRRYPQGETVASLVGIARPWETAIDDLQEAYAPTRRFLDELRWTADAAERFALRRVDPEQPPLRLPEDLIGLQGFERAYDAGLSGLPGLRGESVAGLVTVPPLPGLDVVTTIDLGLSKALYRKLGEQLRVDRFDGRGGFVIVMDLRDGALKALVSRPSFDPAKVLEGALPQAPSWAAPMLNRCFMPRAPGSAFKIVLAGALLQAGLGDAARIYCGAREHPSFRCRNHAAATYDLTEALVHSCNHYFVVAGTERLGRDRFIEWTTRLLGGRHAAEFLSEDLRLSARYGVDYHALLRHGKLPYQVCYGSHPLEVMPLALVRFVAAIACDGKAARPRVRRDAPVLFDDIGLSAATCRTIRAAMARVVREGTARAAVCGLNGVFSVAAKTGTAEVDEATRRNNAWIVGYAPAQPRPRYVIVVCLEHVRDQSHGGETAGPVMAAALAYLDRMDPGAGIALGGAR